MKGCNKKALKGFGHQAPTKPVNSLTRKLHHHIENRYNMQRNKLREHTPIKNYVTIRLCAGNSYMDLEQSTVPCRKH